MELFCNRPTVSQPIPISICSIYRRDWRMSVRCDISDICGEKPTNITWTQTNVEDLVICGKRLLSHWAYRRKIVVWNSLWPAVVSPGLSKNQKDLPQSCLTNDLRHTKLWLPSRSNKIRQDYLWLTKNNQELFQWCRIWMPKSQGFVAVTHQKMVFCSQVR